MDEVYINTSVPSNHLSVVARLLSQASLDQWFVDENGMFIAGESSEDFEVGVTVWQDAKAGPIGVQFHGKVWDTDLAGRVFAITQDYNLPFEWHSELETHTSCRREEPDGIVPSILGVIRTFKKARERA